MRYISEFKIAPELPNKDEWMDRYIESSKQRSNCEIGNLIGNLVGYVTRKSYDQEEIYSLEIQAFAQKDWSEFKQELKEYITSASQLGLSTFNLIMVGKMIQKLEMIGSLKPNPANPSSPVDDN